uniref:J domain-containing protein n=1 Tax=Glossina morsitans morsitans TaxID=37546 RepID=A0A1B0G9M0_GLOMM
MSTLDLCEEYFETRDAYKVFGVSNTATEKELKKAYYKISLLVHPDRVPEEEKVSATEKFKVLSKVYQVLIDKDKRELYDEQGIIDDDDDILETKLNNWLDLWRKIFQPITKEAIENYEKTYINSDLERSDIRKAYLSSKGSIDKIINEVPFLKVDDEDRLQKIVREMIANEEVPEYKIFTEEPARKRKKRHQKYARESREAEKLEAKLRAKEKETEADTKLNTGNSGAGSLEQAILARRQARESSFNSLMEKLTQHYGNDDEDEVIDLASLGQLESDNREMYDLYGDSNYDDLMRACQEEEDNTKLKLYEKVEFCCGIRIQFSKKMPTKICSKCFNMTRIWFNFRQMCLSSQLYLESLQVNENDYSVAAEENKNANFLQSLVEDLQTFRTEKRQEKPAEFTIEVLGQQQIGNDYTFSDTDFEQIICYDGDGGEGADDVNDIDSNEMDNESKPKDYIEEHHQLSEGDNDCCDESIQNNVEQSEILIELTQDDFVEAMSYLNGEDSEELENYIEYITRSDLSIKRLKRRALIQPKPKKRSSTIKPALKPEEKPKLPKPMTFMCSICGNVYTKRPLFQYHLRMHSDLKPYQCDCTICNKSFTLQHQLKAHLNTATHRQKEASQEFQIIEYE